MRTLSLLLMIVLITLPIFDSAAAQILRIEFFNVYPRDNVYVGDRVYVEVQIRNTLQFDVYDVDIEIEVKGDVSLVSEGTKHFDVLGPGASKLRRAVYKMLREGDVSFKAVVTFRNGAVTQRVETSWVTVEVKRKRWIADLYISNIALEPANPAEGENATIIATIANGGTKTARNFTVIAKEGDLVVGRVNVDQLSPGDSMDVKFPLKVKAGIVIRVIVDPDGLIPESNEKNNERSIAIGARPSGEAAAKPVISPVSIEEVTFEPREGIEGSSLESKWEPGGSCSVKIRFTVNDPDVKFVRLHYNLFSDVFEFGSINPSHYYNSVLPDTVRISKGTFEHAHRISCRIVKGGQSKVIVNVTIDDLYDEHIFAYASKEIPVEITPLRAPSGESRITTYMIKKFDAPVKLINRNPVGVSAELVKVLLDGVVVNEKSGGIFSTPIYSIDEWLPNETREFSLARLLDGKLPESPGEHSMKLVWSINPINGIKLVKTSQITVFFKPIPTPSLSRREYDVEGINSTHEIVIDINGVSGFKLTSVKINSSDNCIVNGAEIQNWTIKTRVRGLEEGSCRLSLHPTLEDENGVRLDVSPLEVTVHIRKSSSEVVIEYLPYMAVVLVLIFLAFIIKKFKLLNVEEI